MQRQKLLLCHCQDNDYAIARFHWFAGVCACMTAYVCVRVRVRGRAEHFLHVAYSLHMHNPKWPFRTGHNLEAKSDNIRKQFTVRAICLCHSIPVSNSNLHCVDHNNNSIISTHTNLSHLNIHLGHGFIKRQMLYYVPVWG